MSSQPIHPETDQLRSTAAVERPPFNAGDRLSRVEFERRYSLYPEIKKAELIEGVVYLPSPIRHRQQGKPHAQIMTWLGTYVAVTPGTDFSDNATVRLDFENEPQPDAVLIIQPDRGGRSTIAEDDCFEGPPELTVEIAASSASYDLYDKRRVYRRNGVQEYLVIQMYEKRVDWFVLRDGIYETINPDENGITKSETFPGLWLHEPAFWMNDLAAMLSLLQQGIAAPDHAAFVAQLNEGRLRA